MPKTSPGSSPHLNGVAHRELFLHLLLDFTLPTNATKVVMPWSMRTKPIDPRDTLCRRWITAAYESASGARSGLLHNAMLTASLFVLAKEQDKRSLLIPAMQSYQKMLVLVRRQLTISTELTDDRNPDLAVARTCLWLAFIELLANNSFIGSDVHLSGIEVLLRQAGPHCLGQSRALRCIFFEHRLISISSVCLQRTGVPFYANPAWINFPGRESCEFANRRINMLIDLACGIPSIMVDMDLKSDIGLSTLLIRTQSLLRQMYDWHQRFIGDEEGASTFIDEQSRDDEVFPHKIHFSDFNLAATVLWYYGFRILCTEIIGKLCDRLRKVGKDRKSDNRHSDKINNNGVADVLSGTRSIALADMLTSARYICRSMDYMLDYRRGIVGQMAAQFPLCTASRGFEFAADKCGEDLTLEMAWCRLVVERFAEEAYKIARPF